MAYTITGAAPTYANAFNDVIFSVYDNVRSNDQITYPDFTYICDIYIGATFIRRLKAVPDPIYTGGLFNIKKILQDYMVSVNIPTPLEGVINLGFHSERISYQLKFGSEFGETLTTNEITDSARFVYNSYNKYNISNGSPIYTGVAGFVTDRPSRVSVDESCFAGFIPFYNPTSGAVTVVGKTYSGSGAVVDTENISVAASGLCTLNAAYWGVKTDLVVTDAVATSLTFNGVTYYFDWKCYPRSRNKTVGFLNRYGGFETYDFMMLSSDTISIDRKKIDPLPYAIGASGVVTYNDPHGTTLNFSNKVGRKIKLRSDFVKDGEYMWLEQLIVSPKVDIYNLYGDLKWVRVAMSSTDYEVKYFEKDGISILEIELEYEGYTPQRL
jgi:hypothetical protein